MTLNFNSPSKHFISGVVEKLCPTNRYCRFVEHSNGFKRKKKLCMETFFDKGEGRDIKTLHLKDVIYECPLNVNQAKIHKKNPYQIQCHQV